MNKERRKIIEQAIVHLAAIEELSRKALELIQQAAEEERECYDNLSEGLQAAERGQQMDQVACDLENVQSELESLDCGDLTSQLENCLG